MARPLSKGIEYYPLDVDFLNDLKIRKIMKSCGPNSIAIIILLLGNIYGDEGYFMKWDEDVCFLVADEVGAKEVYVKEVLKKCLQVEFFSTDLFEKFKIITSKGIQRRFFEITKRRKKISVKNEYLLVNVTETGVNVTETNINATETRVSVYKSTQRKEKESKVKESKVNKIKENNIFTTPPPYISAPNFKNQGGVVDDENIKKVIDIFNYSGFPNITPSTKDTLISFAELYPIAWIEEAFKIASDGGKLNLNYVRGILTRWQTNGKENLNKKTDIEKYFDEVDRWGRAAKRG